MGFVLGVVFTLAEFEKGLLATAPVAGEVFNLLESPSLFVGSSIGGPSNGALDADGVIRRSVRGGKSKLRAAEVPLFHSGRPLEGLNSPGWLNLGLKACWDAPPRARS